MEPDSEDPDEFKYRRVLFIWAIEPHLSGSRIARALTNGKGEKDRTSESRHIPESQMSSTPTDHQKRTAKLKAEGRTTPLQIWLLNKHKTKLDKMAKSQDRSRVVMFRILVEQMLDQLP
jgi:hypothetical protein